MANHWIFVFLYALQRGPMRDNFIHSECMIIVKSLDQFNVFVGYRPGNLPHFTSPNYLYTFYKYKRIYD